MISVSLRVVRCSGSLTAAARADTLATDSLWCRVGMATPTTLNVLLFSLAISRHRSI